MFLHFNVFMSFLQKRKTDRKIRIYDDKADGKTEKYQKIRDSGEHYKLANYVFIKLHTDEMSTKLY